MRRRGFTLVEVLVALAITSPQRSPLLPEVPSMAESGLMPPDFDSGIWQGIMVPARTPREVSEGFICALPSLCCRYPEAQTHPLPPSVARYRC